MTLRSITRKHKHFSVLFNLKKKLSESMVRILRSQTPFGYSPNFFLKIKLSPLKTKRLFLPFCEKEGQCGGNGWAETKSHGKVRSKEMLIQKDEKFREEWEKKGPRDPPAHKITRQSQCTFQREEGSGAELVEIRCDKQHLPSLGPAESPSAGPSADTCLVPSHPCHTLDFRAWSWAWRGDRTAQS